VRGFQQVAGATVDGIVGPATWSLLADGKTADRPVKRRL
jgi:peptidoglycan hydrolase-like protein with peptidoglycan-binding domain